MALRKSFNVLVNTTDEQIKRALFTACKSLDIDFYDKAYRELSFYETIICDDSEVSTYKESGNLIIVLQNRDSIKDFIGVANRFILPSTKQDELKAFLFISEYVAPATTREKRDIRALIPSGVTEARFGELYADFIEEKFTYKGIEIYLTKREIEYIILFLFTKEKLTSIRINLYRMRKKFGKEFLTND